MKSGLGESRWVSPTVKVLELTSLCMHWVWCVLILLRVVCAFFGCRTGAEASLGRHSFAPPPPPPPDPILKCTSFEVQPVILPVLFVAVVRFQDSDR